MKLFNDIYESWNQDAHDAICKSGVSKDLKAVYLKLREIGFDRAQTMFIVQSEIVMIDCEYTVSKAIEARKAEKAKR